MIIQQYVLRRLFPCFTSQITNNSHSHRKANVPGNASPILYTVSRAPLLCYHCPHELNALITSTLPCHSMHSLHLTNLGFSCYFEHGSYWIINCSLNEMHCKKGKSIIFKLNNSKEWNTNKEILGSTCYCSNVIIVWANLG